MLSAIASSTASASAPDSPAKVREASQQFEALLLGQFLRAARQGGGWLGAGDASSDCALEYAEQQFAAVMAANGGLGLAKLIAQGLEPPAKQ